MLKTIRMPFFSAEEGGGDDNQQESEKTFTQADVDRIVGERLSREKGKYSDYDDLKEVADSLKAWGYEGSPAEVKAIIKQQAEERRKAAELASLEEEAEITGTSPEMLAEMKRLQKRLDEIESEKKKQQKEMEDKQKADETFDNDIKELQEAHPTVDVKKLGENKKFIEFVNDARPGLTLLQLYNKYVDLVGGAEKSAIEKMKSNDDRSTFGARGGKAEPSGGTHGLTDRQQKLAKDNGMSNKEYFDLLNQVRE